MNAADSIIETIDLSKRFGKFTAVKNISFSVRRGEIFGFLGANGAGKTTAIRMLCGLLIPSGGSGRVAGYDISKNTSKLRKHIGYMSQKFSLYNDFLVKDNLFLYGSIYGINKKTLYKRIDEISLLLGLEELLSKKTGTLPWGWQQRLSLACANLHQPEVLFLDEPTGSVDPVSRRNFWDLIISLSEKGTTIFITTHHMDEAEYCHRISIMVQGSIAAIDTPPQLKLSTASLTLQEAFIKIISASACNGAEK
jgi:ABC-2 type transport system ATP-binding protein